MKAFLSHFSAARVWNIQCFDSLFGSRELSAGVESRGGSEKAPAGRAGAGLIEITVSEGETKHARKGRLVHYCKLDLPKGAVVVRDGVRVASPELVFLQLAGRLDIQRIILLGLQMCSHPPGKPTEAVTTKQKLVAFIEKASWHRGCRKAKRAVKYVENGSASVMESLVYMMLTLPHALGGYGLGGAVFNYEVMLEGDAGRRLGQKRCFLDLYYRRANLAVEYESFAFHGGPLEQGRDALRAAALERQGIEVARVSTIQAYDSAAFKVFALNLAARLGKRVSIRAGRFKEMHESLRSLLPAPSDEASV
jgi:hypothetical protein